MKRGESGLCLVVGVDKPSGMSSHDVVNACRRIFGEKRVGHTGTLDPLASGVLPICVGPATRLDAYLAGHDKRYRVRVAFGAATTTDDRLGDVIREGAVPDEVLDPLYAHAFVASLVGPSKQLPPVYSAIKRDGKKACDEARKGNVIELEPRDIEVYDAHLVGIYGADGCEAPAWEIDFHVSKGTYIRALARDIGNAMGCPAHVAELRRTAVGSLTLDECMTLEALAELKERAALDPVRLLGVRFAYADAEVERLVANGNAIAADKLVLCERRRATTSAEFCACTAGVRESCEPPADAEIIAVVAENKLRALYAYDEARRVFRSRCVFQTGVSRGVAY